MTLRLTKPSLSLPRPQSTAKPETSARVGPAVTGKPDPARQIANTGDRLKVSNAAQQIANSADRFETTASRPSREERIGDRRPGGTGGIDRHSEQIPVNNDIYPGIFENFPSGAEQGAESIGTSGGGQPIPEHEQPWNQETYGERIDRNRADRGLPPIFSKPEGEIFSPHGPGSGNTYGERIDRNRADQGLPPLFSE